MNQARRVLPVLQVCAPTVYANFGHGSLNFPYALSLFLLSMQFFIEQFSVPTTLQPHLRPCTCLFAAFLKVLLFLFLTASTCFASKLMVLVRGPMYPTIRARI